MADWKREIGAMTLFVPNLDEARTFYAGLLGLDAQPLDEGNALLRLEGVLVCSCTRLRRRRRRCRTF